MLTQGGSDRQEFGRHKITLNKSFHLHKPVAGQGLQAVARAVCALVLTFAGSGLALVSAGSQAATSAASTSTSTSTFNCSTAGGDQCHMVLYSSSCMEGSVVNGKPSLICTKSFITEFTLRNGQSKTVEGLPNDFKQCVVKPNEKASFPACARSAS